MHALDELSTILKPAGAGVYLVSAGKAEQLHLQQRLYDVKSEGEVRAKFRAALEAIPTAKAVLLAVPSDVGAGFQRGANMGPQGLRVQLLAEAPDWRERAKGLGLVDAGDVFTVPQYLHDEMLAPAQLAAARRAMYPDVGPDAEGLPVSPLSIAERAWDLVFQLNPRAKPFTLGGDHSTALPVVQALDRRLRRSGGTPWGLVQMDAHTDLLPERLGVKYCFGTWSWHANELLGRRGRLTQVGIRASGRNQEHWESTLDVRQFWAKDVLASPERALDEVVEHVKSTGVKAVYFSNDVDGTDSRWADATGTPEPNGLEPDWVVALIRRLGGEVGLLGGDVMEVAPILTRTPTSAARTLALGVRYLRETLAAALGSEA